MFSCEKNHELLLSKRKNAIYSETLFENSNIIFQIKNSLRKEFFFSRKFILFSYVFQVPA